jgi:hypothetical protein
MVKAAIEDHFKGDWLPFFQRYLPEVKKAGGDEYKALCPWHDDHNPSLGINASSGKYYCQVCQKKGHAFHLYAKLHGLDDRRDFPKILAGIAKDFRISDGQKPKRRLVKTYDYHTASGELLFQTCRYEPKDFSQRRPDGKGGWIWKDVFKEIEPVLYRLPAVLQAREVLIVEGEKDADNVTALGLTATTCPMGAKKWRESYNEALRGKDVVLIPDNDLPGKEHMAQVGASLRDMAGSLKLLELPDLSSKGDVSDWLAQFNGNQEVAAERLSILIENAPTYEPKKPATIEDAVLLETDLFRVELPERECLLHPWLRHQSIVLIPGWRGVGKTWFGLGMVVAITRGECFGPWQVGNPVPCLYLEAEMPPQDVRDRLRLLTQGREGKAPLYVYADGYANLLGLPRANLLSETWRGKMKAILLARGVKFWVLDNLASLAAGIDENSSREWSPINSWLLDLRFSGITTALLHHTGKGGDQRGTSAREDNLDCSLTLWQPYRYVPEDGARFICSFKKARVATSDLPLIADTQFRLTEDQDGCLVWAWENVRKETRKEILRLSDEGHKGTDIAAALGITRGRVSQVIKKATEDGILSKTGKLTQSGFREVNEMEKS